MRFRYSNSDASQNEVDSLPRIPLILRRGEKSVESFGLVDKGHPACMVSYKDGEKQVKYLRFGNSDEIEPFVIHRDFHGIRKFYNEIIEELRHYHRLYHDLDKNQLLKFDDRGDENDYGIDPRLLKEVGDLGISVYLC